VWVSRFQSCGINKMEMVDQTSVSWNQVKEWLSRLDAVRRAA